MTRQPAVRGDPYGWLVYLYFSFCSFLSDRGGTAREYQIAVDSAKKEQYEKKIR
jgi:hypothetical protein